MSALSWILMLGVTAIWLAMAGAVWWLATVRVAARREHVRSYPHRV